MAKRKNSKRSVPGSRRPLVKFLEPGSSVPSCPAQKPTKLWLNFPTVLYATNAGGTIAANFAPTLAGLANVSALQAQFAEFRMLAMDFHVEAVETHAGSTKFFISDSDGSTAPTATQANQVNGWVLPNNHINPRSFRVFKYRSQNLTDLIFLSTATQASTQNCALKIYTDTATYRAPGSAQMWNVWARVLFQFRGAGSATA